ncbi:MAG: metallophosphoesterase [Xenococcaceae cyanobacterium]
MKNKIVVLSDIHIGTNTPTVWYQKDIHQPYLLNVLDWTIKNAESIQELIFLGDVVDFWTYPPNQEPPSFDDIINANLDLFGSEGKLSQVLTALQGNVTYVRGNHDITITQEDLAKIQNPQGYKIKFSGDIYYPIADSKKIVCTHGHLYTMFNAPYESSNNPIAPLPLGQFITRAVAFMRQQKLQPGQTVADLKDSGEPGYDSMVNGLLKSILDVIRDKISTGDNQQARDTLSSLAKTILQTTANATGISQTQPIKLAGGKETTFQEAEKIYENLFSEWSAKNNSELTAYKSVMADMNGSYMGWFAQKLAFEVGAELVVMGHTHTPISGLQDSLVNYINTGFSCPAKPDIGKKHPSFVLIDINDCHADVLQVVNNEGTYSIEPCYAAKAKVSDGNISAGDYSSYVIIDNSNGKSDLNLKDYGEESGIYVVVPPQKIARGEIVKFWLQDKPGICGSDGWAKYSCQGSEINLTYKCPTVTSLLSFSSMNNNCSGANFYTKSAGNDWSELNKVTTSGHPFCVKFVL